MKYSVTFARNQDIDNIQHETVNAKDEQDARGMFTVCDCYVYSCTEITSPDRDDAAILAAARTVSPDAVLTSGELSRREYGEAQEPRTVNTLQAFAEKRDRQFNKHYYGKSTPGFGSNG